jgi:aspartate racemase
MDQVHDAYIQIALTGEVRADTRAFFDAMGHRLIKEHGCEAVMLGGTDLSLVYKFEPPSFPYIHCAAVHADAIVQHAA